MERFERVNDKLHYVASNQWNEYWNSMMIVGTYDITFALDGYSYFMCYKGIPR